MDKCKILRIAHRGASGYAPENTIAAFEKALKMGVDMVELDVRRTRDGELVVFHDAHLRRLTNGKGHIKKLFYRQLQRYDINGHNIPRLEDVLEIIRGCCQINIHIKERGLAEGVTGLVKKFDIIADTLISSFLHTELVKIKVIDSRFRVAVLLSSSPFTARSVIKLANKIGAEALNIPLGACNERLIRAAKQEGLKVNIWTVDEYDDIAWLKELGVDGIISNFPDRI